MGAILLAILATVLKAILPALIEAWRDRSGPTHQDSAPSPVKDTLRNRVLNSGWGKIGALGVLCIVLCAGCASNRTVYVPDGEPVRLRKTIPAADVWVLDKDGKPVAGKLDLPEGWYCLPVPDDNTAR